MTKHRDNRDDNARQIVPEPADAELLQFLLEQFSLQPRAAEPGIPNSAPDRYPEKIKVCAVFGVAGRDHGPQLILREWKPMQQALPTRESLVIFCNEILAKCAHDSTVLGKRQRYGVFAYSNLKGPEAYERHLISCVPGPQEYSERNPAPDEDEASTAKDRHLEMSLAHTRYMFETTMEAIGAVMSRQDATIESQQRVIVESYRSHGETIKLQEELLDRRAERDLKVAKAALQQRLLEQGVGMLQMLAPPVIAYLTKGKAGVPEALKQFLESLSEEQSAKLLGGFDANGAPLGTGLLSVDQVNLLGAMARGEVPVSRVSDFMASLTPTQLMGAQQILNPAQLAGLAALADAVAKATAANNNTNANGAQQAS